MIPADTQEKAYFSHAPKPCGKTHRGCGQCICDSYQLLDSEIIPYDHYRSQKHFDKFCIENPDAKKDDLSKHAGYSSFETFETSAKALGGDVVVQKLVGDINHSTSNQVKYVDRSVKAENVWFSIYVHFNSHFLMKKQKQRCIFLLDTRRTTFIITCNMSFIKRM